MKLVTYRYDGADHLGALIGDDRVAYLAASYAAWLATRGASYPYEQARMELPDDMLRMLALGESGVTAARQAMSFASGSDGDGPRGERLVRPLSEVRLLAPLPKPGKLLCIGLNYRDHVEEVGLKMPERPLIFAKYSNTVIGPDDAILLPPKSVSDQVDYEAELGVVIGKKGKGVSEERAMEYVAGYTVMNDISARDVQMGDGQWVRGKTFDTFAPMGPYLVTPDEVPDPHNLKVSLTLNGRVMQNSNSRNLIFDIPRLISFIAQAITLEPGDVIATGTPPGVGMGRKPPVWLKAGDEMVVEVEKVGSLRNSVR